MLVISAAGGADRLAGEAHVAGLLASVHGVFFGVGALRASAHVRVGEGATGLLEKWRRKERVL